MIKAVVIGLSAFSLIGCVTTRQQSLVWVRADGQSISATSEIQKRYELDRAECVGDAAQSTAIVQPIFPSLYMIAAAQNQRRETASAVMQGCMAKKGYLLIPSS